MSSEPLNPPEDKNPDNTPADNLTAQQLQERVAYLEGVNQKILSSLEAVRSLITLQEEIRIEHGPEPIYRQGIERIFRLVQFKVAAFYLFTDDLIDIKLQYVHPETFRDEVEKELELQIKAGTFSWALKQNSPVIVPPLQLNNNREILLHSLTGKNRILGMFLCQLSAKRGKIYQETLDFLSIALTNLSMSMENARLFQETKSYNILLEKQVEERTRQLNEAKNHAEAVSRAKSEFLANMSHEIRTPMNSIIGFTDMLAETPLNDKQREYLYAINTSGSFLLNLINDILDFSKIEAGKLEIEHIEFDLFHVIRDVFSITGSKAVEKGLELLPPVDFSLNWKIVGDPVRLRQVLMNLVGNAIKFTEKGQIRIALAAEEETDRHIEIRFAIEDQGIGISEDKTDAIFEVFSQADGSTTRKFGGTGLGLSISNQLVNLMGGERIFLKSTFGSGSTFYFSLTFLKGSRLAQSKKDKAAADKTVKAKGYKILLVEDNPQNIKLASVLLSNQGHRVVVAEDGKLAVEAVKKERFDVILMDVQMPVMDGLTATREIRSNGYTVPIIAMTASAMKGDKEKCLEAGMDEYMSKPIKIKEMGSIIQSTIEKKRS